MIYRLTEVGRDLLRSPNTGAMLLFSGNFIFLDEYSIFARIQLYLRVIFFSKTGFRAGSLREMLIKLTLHACQYQYHSCRSVMGIRLSQW